MNNAKEAKRKLGIPTATRRTSPPCFLKSLLFFLCTAPSMSKKALCNESQGVGAAPSFELRDSWQRNSQYDSLLRSLYLPVSSTVCGTLPCACTALSLFCSSSPIVPTAALISHILQLPYVEDA